MVAIPRADRTIRNAFSQTIANAKTKGISYSIPKVSQSQFRDMPTALQNGLLKDNPELIKFVENPTQSQLISAASADGNILSQLENPSIEVTVAAVANSPDAVTSYTNNLNETISSATNINETSAEMKQVFTAMVGKNPRSVSHMLNFTSTASAEAAKVIAETADQQSEAYLAAVNKQQLITEFEESQTEILTTAINKDPAVIKQVTNPSVDLQTAAITKDWTLVAELTNPDPSVITLANNLAERATN